MACRVSFHLESKHVRGLTVPDRICDFDAKMRKKVSACDFSWFMSVAAPDAPAGRLKTVCDWGNWVFPFDDSKLIQHFISVNPNCP